MGGTITAANSKPFWRAGKVSGATMATLGGTSKGRYGWSVARTTGESKGVYTITFAQATPNAEYTVLITGTSDARFFTTSTYYATITITSTLTAFDIANAKADCSMHFVILT